MFGRKQKTSYDRYGGNPLYAQPRPPGTARRFVFGSILLFLVIGALSIIFIFSPSFQITNVTVPSTLFITEQKFRSTIDNILSTRYLGIIPRSSFWALRERAFERQLHDIYPYADFLVQKKYPNELAISLREPIFLFDWVTGDGSEYYVNRDGIIVYALPQRILLTLNSITEKPGEPQILEIPERFINERDLLFPLVFDPQKRYTGERARVASQGLLNIIERLTIAFARTTGTLVSYVDLGTRPDHLRIVTEAGWTALWNEQDDIDLQIQRLATLLRGKLQGSESKLEYVDLRFGDRLYYKLK